MAGNLAAVIELLCSSAALLTFTQDRCVIREIQGHALIKGVERALPEFIIAILLGVANNAAFNLIDLFKSSLHKNCRENFAANSAGAVSDDWLIFEVVVLSGLNL